MKRTLPLFLRRPQALPALWLAGAALTAGAQTPAPTAAPQPSGTGASGITASAADAWQFGAVLDVAASSRELALGSRKRGLGLGHSDVTAYGPVGRHLQAQITAAAHQDAEETEVELEEAFLQTRTLPAGFVARAGRFSSQIGYLNEQHPHADDFVQRPLLYRAFLGNHWYDDGVRLNWTAPTDLYLRLGAEVFRGHQLVRDAVKARSPGAIALSGRVGGDLGLNQSWQAGLALLHNRRVAGSHHEAEGEEHHDDHDDHDHDAHEAHDAHHAHGATYSGRRLWLADLAWKWAPQGNNRSQQVRLAWEYAQVSGALGQRHHASYLSVAWRFAPQWEVGARADTLRVRERHEDGVERGRLREAALMLAYKPTHAQTLRVQLTGQRARGSFDDPARHAVQLQYILNFGAHAAHTF